MDGGVGIRDDGEGILVSSPSSKNELRHEPQMQRSGDRAINWGPPGAATAGREPR